MTLRDLEAKAARERSRAETAAAATAGREAALAAKRDAGGAQQRARSRRAPTGLAGSVHSFWGGLGFIGLLATAGALWLSDALGDWAGVLLGAAGALGVYLVGAWTYFSWWRTRLRFRLTGYDAIRGDDDSGDAEVRWIALEVRVTLAADEVEARRAVVLALDILASRANGLLASNQDTRVQPGQHWAVHDDLSARGEAWKKIYVTGLLRRWLAGEMNEVAARWPAVRAVEVDARFTDRSFTIPTDRMQ